MSKKHKKIFKQKIKEMLSDMERKQPIALLPEQPPETKEIKTPIKPEPTVISSITPIPIVKSDLKKIVLMLGVMVLILVASVIISLKTNWFLILADKIYNWAQLSS